MDAGVGFVETLRHDIGRNLRAWDARVTSLQLQQNRSRAKYLRRIAGLKAQNKATAKKSLGVMSIDELRAVLSAEGRLTRSYHTDARAHHMLHPEREDDIELRAVFAALEGAGVPLGTGC